MSIDWITVSAQIVNFLILVWLLKRFLYQPVVNAMDKREQDIAKRSRSAVEREQKADEAATLYRNKSEELERDREAILAKVKEDAEQQKKALLSTAREEVAATRRDWQLQADQEKDEFFNNLRKQSATAVQSIARKALHDLANTDLERQVIDAFIERLRALDTNAPTDTTEPVSITTAFELDVGVRERVSQAVREHIAADVEVAYSESPALLCGIELTHGGRRLSWSLRDYMENLTHRVEKAFSPTDNTRDNTGNNTHDNSQHTEQAHVATAAG